MPRLSPLAAWQKLLSYLLQRHYGLELNDTVFCDDAVIQSHIDRALSPQDAINCLVGRYALVRTDRPGLSFREPSPYLTPTDILLARHATGLSRMRFPDSVRAVCPTRAASSQVLRFIPLTKGTHTMFDLLMKRQGQRLLIEAGWPGQLEWQWRLSHCQGDGCALYGWPARDHLLTLLPALAQRQGFSASEVQHLTTLLTLYDITVVLQRNALSSRYSHARCITPVVEGFPHDEFPAYTSFCLALQQDIRDLCQQAEQTGYRLLDATTPRSANEALFSRQTQHFELRAVADMPDAAYSADHTAADDALDICLERLLLHARGASADHPAGGYLPHHRRHPRSAVATGRTD
ncbi:TA system toxin CbtA family protein [Cronobacter turicensis]